MNNDPRVKMDRLLEEMKSNIEQAGRPSPENSRDGFYDLCKYVTDWMIRKYDLNKDADINWGYCFIWAYLVWALWPHGGITFKTCTGHVVVVKNGLYYDSEHCDGHSNLKKFCSFQYREKDGIKHVGVEEMTWYWARAGKELKELRRLVRKLTPSIYKYVRMNGNCYWNNTWEFDSIGNLEDLAEVS